MKDYSDYLINLADVDMSNAVIIKVDNPFYKKSIPMELGFEWPEHKMQIIQAIKEAVRLGLTISFHSENEKASRFMHNYYEEYSS